MSRSIHTNTRDLRARGRHGAVGVDEARRELATKRGVKRAIARERAASAVGPSPALVLADQVAIHVRDAGPYVHYPAREDDLRAVLARLPPGVATGLAGIVLELGAEEQAELAREENLPLEPVDPWVGRVGYECVPGVWHGDVCGVYEPWSATIRLFAYVFDPARPGLELLEPYLALSMLGTLVHEVAHHHDHTTRVARGRWRARDREKNEAYAERLEFDWVRTCVVPHLAQTRPAAVRDLEAWIAKHGGVALGLDVLASADSRFAPGARGVRVAFSLRGAFLQLFRDVEQGTDLVATRVGFARELHYGEFYEPALAALAAVLAEHPLHADARALEADIWVHQGRLDPALARAREVLATTPDHAEAWEVVRDVALARRDWAGVLAAADGLLATTSEWGVLNARLARGRALLELGRLDDAERALAAVTAAPVSRRIEQRALALRAIVSLRQGHPAEALAHADASERAAAHAPPTVRAELAAVRHDAARAQGGCAPRVRAEVLDGLERAGHEAWAARLRAAT